jgi:hypothetical protein
MSDAESVLSSAQFALLREMRRFTAARLESAGAALQHVREASREALPRAVHWFLRECWDTLDGLGRQVALCTRQVIPELKPLDPAEMRSQLTLYTVRRDLHREPASADHPLTLLLWHRTRDPSSEPYDRLSFLYNLSLFFEIPLSDGRWLPGHDDLPETVQELVRSQDIEAVRVVSGLEQIMDWLRRFVDRCEDQMARAYSRHAAQ